jgi:hypothetical protein
MEPARLVMTATGSCFWPCALSEGSVSPYGASGVRLAEWATAGGEDWRQVSERHQYRALHWWRARPQPASASPSLWFFPCRPWPLARPLTTVLVYNLRRLETYHPSRQGVTHPYHHRSHAPRCTYALAYDRRYVYIYALRMHKPREAPCSMHCYRCAREHDSEQTQDRQACRFRLSAPGEALVSGRLFAFFGTPVVVSS